MFMAMVSWSFPIRQLTVFLYCRLTDRPYSYKQEDFIDLCLAIAVTIWVERFEVYLHRETDYPEIADTPHIVFMANVVTDLQTGRFHFDFLLAIVAALFWLRMLMMLKLTKTFGPMIKIILTMLNDLMTFSVIWII